MSEMLYAAVAIRTDLVHVTPVVPQGTLLTCTWKDLSAASVKMYVQAPMKE